MLFNISSGFYPPMLDDVIIVCQKRPYFPKIKKKWPRVILWRHHVNWKFFLCQYKGYCKTKLCWKYQSHILRNKKVMQFSFFLILRELWPEFFGPVQTEVSKIPKEGSYDHEIFTECVNWININCCKVSMPKHSWKKCY